MSSSQIKSFLISSTESHYNDVIMSSLVSPITSLTIVYSTVYSRADQRKHQSSASLATGEYPAHMSSNAENVSIWWRHHAENRRRDSDITRSMCAKNAKIYPENISKVSHSLPWTWQFSLFQSSWLMGIFRPMLTDNIRDKNDLYWWNYKPFSIKRITISTNFLGRRLGR